MGKPGPLSGQKLGDKYLLGDLLGKGGFGAVYQAHYLLLNRPQAIKILLEEHFSDPKFRERFIREARTLAALDHPNIIHVDELGEESDLIYLVMPYIGGGTLQDILKRRGGPLSQEEARRYLKQICAALGYAHTRQVVHLDLKPLNLLIHHEDGRLLLSDFGLAHLLEQGAVTGGTSLSFGTPSYMAPEHFDAQPERRSDLYALGVILYQMLTGRLPFEGSTPRAIMHNILNKPPTPLRSLRPELPPALEGMMARALAKRPADRYQSAGELLSEFQSAVDKQESHRILEAYSTPKLDSQPMQGKAVQAEKPPLLPIAPYLPNPKGLSYTPTPEPPVIGWEKTKKDKPGEPPINKPRVKRIPYPFITGAAILWLLLLIVVPIFGGFGPSPRYEVKNDIVGGVMACLLLFCIFAALRRAYQLKLWWWLLLIALSFGSTFSIPTIFPGIFFLDIIVLSQFFLIVLVFSILGPRQGMFRSKQK